MRLVRIAGPVMAGAITVLTTVAGLASPAPAALATARAAVDVASSAAKHGDLSYAVPSSESPAGATDWPAYLDGPGHSSYNSADKAITPATAGHLAVKWRFDAGADFLASPVVGGGAVYIGAPTGWFYKLNEVTGAVEAKAFIGHQSGGSCKPLGVVDTATIALDPKDQKLTVYVGGPDGYLYALYAANLAVKWKSVVALPKVGGHTYFDWSSPTVSHGRIYIGVASYCNRPSIPGAVIGYNQVNGQQFGEFHTVPQGDVGGSVWSSVAVAPGGYVYASVANGPTSDPELGYSESIVKLTPTLSVAGSFQVPAAQVTSDGDFGASPTLFGQYVGACNKNGIFYALNRSTMTLAWQAEIGAASNAVSHANCLAAPVYNGTDLFLAGPEVTIKGSVHRGSVQERNARTGELIWKTGLPNAVTSSPSMNGVGVLAVGTWDFTGTPDATYLINAATGAIIKTLVKGRDFAQGVFANGWLFTANSYGVYAWKPAR
jgi:outer membrane protein assembly factor BamB